MSCPCRRMSIKKHMIWPVDSAQPTRKEIQGQSVVRNMSTIKMYMAIMSNHKPPANEHPIHLIRHPKVMPSRPTSRCSAVLQPDVALERRSGNYKPPLWDFDYIQSFHDVDFEQEEEQSKRAAALLQQVEKLLEEAEKEGGVGQLELIDDLQKLGISYHFQDKINQIFNSIYHYNNLEEGDLYSAALRFRLLRQHAFKVSQEVFDGFKDKMDGLEGNMNIKGLLEVYEASFMLTEGEETLEAAREFATTTFLQKKQQVLEDDQYLSLMVGRALELPLHWSLQRPYATWFIDAYERRPDMNPLVLELAKLDFNILQATHRAELQHLSRWWKQTGLAEKLPFARDRVVECYLLTMGLFEPEYAYSRIIGTKVNALVTIIDDVFDVYGTMEELLLFNNAIQRWDDEAVERLPKYMQMCFEALDNFVNEMAYDALKEHGLQIIPYLRKSWVDLCSTYMQEAKWYSEGYKPRLQEYIDNACISISVPLMLTHAFFALPNPIEKEAAHSCFNKYHNIARYSGTIARLANDLGTSPDEMKRGDVPKSVQCYMNERGGDIDIQEAREYVRSMMSEAWKKMNGEILDSSLPKSFVRCAFEFGRIAHYVYQDGEDGHGIQNSRVKDRISALLFYPIV